MEPDLTRSASGRPELRFDANLKWLFTEFPFERRFMAAAAHGFEAVEVAAPYSYPTRALRQLLADAGLQLVLINSPGGEAGSPTAYGSACYPDDIAQFRAGVSLALDYATALDTPYIHLMAGIVPDSVPYDVAYAVYLENLAWAAEQAAQTDVTLLVEVLNQVDVPGFVLRSQRQAVEAIETVGNSRVRLMFDIYHCQLNEGSVTTRWRELSPLIRHIQVADTPDRHEPGTGELRWEFLFGEIAARGYDGWIGCEYRFEAVSAGDTERVFECIRDAVDGWGGPNGEPVFLAQYSSAPAARLLTDRLGLTVITGPDSAAEALRDRISRSGHTS